MQFFTFLSSLFAGLRTANHKRGGFALIKLGGAVADIRGSIGGIVFSRNKSGAIARNRTIPTNPSSALQGEIRSAMSAVRAAFYETLTDAQRALWNDYAFNTEVTNRLGESTKVTGYNMFCRVNLASLYTGGDIITAAPTTFDLGETDPALALEVSAGAENQLDVTFDTGLAWVNETGSKVLIYASRPQNPGVNYFKGPYQYAGSVLGNATTAPTSPATLSSPFEVTAGQKVFIQARILRADGRLSAPFRTSVVAGA
jgi:hypothetical protein